MSPNMSRICHVTDHLTLGMWGNIFVTSASSSINQSVVHQYMVSSVAESTSCNACTWVLILFNPTLSLESLLSLLKSRSLSLTSSSSLLDDSTLSDIIALALTKKLASSLRMTGPSIYYKIAVLLFELYRTAHPDGPFTPVKEGNKDVFPRTVFVPYLE